MPLNSSSLPVAFFLPSFRGGGAERVTINLANGLAVLGLRVIIIVLNSDGPLGSFVSSKVEIVDLKVTRAYRSILPLAFFLRKTHLGVLFSILPHMSVAALLAKKLAISTTHIVVSEHNTLSKSLRNADSVRGRLLHLPMKFTYRWASVILAVSSGVADDLKNVLRLREPRIQVINNIVINHDFFKKANQVPEHPWFCPKQQPVIISVGRLTRAKNFTCLIDAFKIVNAKIPSKLIILGEGHQRDLLEDKITSLSLEHDVSLPGFIANPLPLIKHSDIFILSSLWEGLPTVLIEAIACGTRVISTDCMSGPREILENGKHGALVSVGDHKAIACAAITALQSSTSRTPPKSYVWDLFSASVIEKEYIRLINQIVDENKPA
jgi:glycosyltransferase involved in cell wall biosynthesis